MMKILCESISFEMIRFICTLISSPFVFVYLQSLSCNQVTTGRLQVVKNRMLALLTPKWTSYWMETLTIPSIQNHAYTVTPDIKQNGTTVIFHSYLPTAVPGIFSPTFTYRYTFSCKGKVIPPFVHKHRNETTTSRTVTMGDKASNR